MRDSTTADMGNGMAGCMKLQIYDVKERGRGCGHERRSYRGCRSVVVVENRLIDHNSKSSSSSPEVLSS